MSFLAAGEGFEPSQTESESVVLPLHNPAICCCFVVPCRRDECYYSKQFRIVNSIFQIFLPAPFCPVHRPFVNFFPPPHFLFTQKKCGFIIPPEQEVCGGTSARLFSQKERRLWVTHHKAPVPTLSGTTRRGEYRRFRRMPLRAGPGAHTAYKYAGNRKTEGLWPGYEVKWLRVCPPVLFQEEIE